MTNHSETKQHNISNHATRAASFWSHLCTLGLLADLLLIVAHSALSKTSALRRPVSLVCFSMLYLLFAAAYEKAHTTSTLKQSLTDAIRTVLLPGILAAFFANCRIFFSSEGQTPITFAKQMKTCAIQLFWSLDSSRSGHPEMGVAWVLISLFWCVCLYSIVKTILKTRKTAILRLAFAILCAILCAAAGYFLHRKNTLLPLALDKSLVGFLLYTVGAEFAALIFTTDSSTDTFTDFSTDIFTDPSTDTFTDVSTDASATLRKTPGLIKHIQTLCPTWLNSYAWVPVAIFAHALDGMTDPWWNHGSGIIRILLRFILMILSTDLLIYVIDSIKAMRATGIKPIALIFKSVIEVFKPITRKVTASQTINRVGAKSSNTQRIKPEGNYILTAISNLITNHPKMSLTAFYILFAYTYLIRTIETTMFTILIADYKPYYNKLFKLSVFILLLFALKELYQSTTNKRFLAYICTLAIGFAHWRTNGSFNFFILCVLIVAMTDKSMKKILTISIIITVSVLLTAFWASQNGYIYNLTYPDGGHALGTVYKTDCMALWFYTLLKYAVLRDGAFMWFEYPLLLALVLYLYHLTKAATSTICMIGFIAACFLIQTMMVLKKTHNKVANTKIRDWNISILSYAYPIGAILSYISVFAFTNFAQVHSVGKFASIAQRLVLSQIAFQKFPLTLLGQLVPQKGAGGIIQSSVEEYFFLDNAYVQLLIVWGFLLLVLVLIYTTRVTKFAVMSHLKIFFLALLVIAAHSVIEHHLSQYWYNTFIILAYCSIEKINFSVSILERV